MLNRVIKITNIKCIYFNALLLYLFFHLFSFSFIKKVQHHAQENRESNYELYHHYINAAEKSLFEDYNIHDCITYYDSAFNQFEFVFIKDILNAIQIAHLHQKPIDLYLIKGLENELMLSDFKGSVVLDALRDNSKLNQIYASNYVNCRTKYIKRIDLELLGKSMDIFIEDQIAKALPRVKYGDFLIEYIKKIKSIIIHRGYPGEKLIGVDRDSIFYEIGFPQLDFRNRIKTKYPNENLNYLLTDREYSLSSTMIFIPLFHNNYSFIELENLFKQEISKGNIHPREVGVLYDHMYARWKFSKSHDKLIPSMKTAGFFFINLIQDKSYISVDSFPSIEVTNKLRTKWNVTSLEHDQKKSEYALKNGLRLYWGFWNTL